MDYPKRHIPDNYIHDSFFDDIIISPSNIEEKQLKAKIYEEDNTFFLDIEIQGFDKDEIKIYIEKNQLVVEGKREDIIEEDDDIYIKQESNYAYCQRIFSLEGIIKSNIKASYENGHIYIQLPKISNTVPESNDLY